LPEPEAPDHRLYSVVGPVLREDGVHGDVEDARLPVSAAFSSGEHALTIPHARIGGGEQVRVLDRKPR
jgi:hypothetical protein